MKKQKNSYRLVLLCGTADQIALFTMPGVAFDSGRTFVRNREIKFSTIGQSQTKLLNVTVNFEF